jgi:hypothetical protein
MRREHLLNIAQLYEKEADLVEHSEVAILESLELIERAAKMLRY